MGSEPEQLPHPVIFDRHMQVRRRDRHVGMAGRSGIHTYCRPDAPRSTTAGRFGIERGVQAGTPIRVELPASAPPLVECQTWTLSGPKLQCLPCLRCCCFVLNRDDGRGANDHPATNPSCCVCRVLHLARCADCESARAVGKVDGGDICRGTADPVSREFRAGLLVDGRDSAGISRWTSRREQCRLPLESLLANWMGGRALLIHATNNRELFASLRETHCSARSNQRNRRRGDHSMASVAVTSRKKPGVAFWATSRRSWHPTQRNNPELDREAR